MSAASAQLALQVAGLHVAGALELEGLAIDSPAPDFVNTQGVVYWMRLEAALLVVNCIATYFKGLLSFTSAVHQLRPYAQLFAAAKTVLNRAV